MPQSTSTELGVLVLAGISVTGLVLGTRQLGQLEFLELAVYDAMVRVRSEVPVDNRLLIVAITEDDIRTQKRWPLPDRVYAEALSQLQQYQPRVIGLDVLRDIPVEPGHAALTKELRRSNVVAIQSLGNTPEEAIPAPPNVSANQVGFNDLILDPDGVIRRNLMFVSDGATESVSFATRLAMQYLNNSGDRLPKGDFVLGATFSPLRANSGGYQRIDAAGEQILLNYRSAQYPSEVVTLNQVLRKQANPALIKDRVVLIGTTAPSAKDLFFTPFSAAKTANPKMPGVVIHAQMLSQTLTAAAEGRSLFWFWSEPIEVLWIISWAIAGGVLAWWVQRPLLLILSGTGLLLLLVGTGYSLFLHQAWVPVAAPAMAAIAVGSFVVAYQTQYARQQQQIVMKLLGQQTSPEIALALWNSRDRLLQSGMLAGQTLTVTILFIDIRNFSGISEQHPPEVMMDWLNEYMCSMTQAVHQHHGIVNKFMGDGLMAVFGVPVPRLTVAEIAEDARQTVACAVEMGDRLQTLNQDWQQRGLPVVQMRAGIYTGNVMAGSLGGKNRLEYAVIGDSVNIAARLEACKKDNQMGLCRILIARETLDHLQEQFYVESWGQVQLRGRQSLVEIFQVLGYADSSNRPNELDKPQPELYRDRLITEDTFEAP
ncbi:CHASE2 domain-containing protein [Leptolyngbya sp. Cla-17]|uniref:CHASE2 domain-containing protein n=1 Tax=Leptolyngbya sp. Cla-17 TaxID=2803751 RepID=UPI001492D05B|nr:adenylate/guanylate cyclase domain-containing protein [Leptolyngbya sp. Cla-17]